MASREAGISFLCSSLAHRFPFYYELKVVFLLWLVSPVSRGSLGSSMLYRRVVHPGLMRREEDIDHFLQRVQEQSYNTAIKFGSSAFQYVTSVVMQTAIKVRHIVCCTMHANIAVAAADIDTNAVGVAFVAALALDVATLAVLLQLLTEQNFFQGGGGLVHHLKKSYSLTDLSSPNTMTGEDDRVDFGTAVVAGRRAISYAKSEQEEDEDDEGTNLRSRSLGEGSDEERWRYQQQQQQIRRRPQNYGRAG